MVRIQGGLIMESKITKTILYDVDGTVHRALKTYLNNASKITKIQEDSMYENFGIIPNHIYNFQFKKGLNIYGIIMNFDSNTFCIKGIKGMYIVKRSELDSVSPSNMSMNEWEESRKKYLESFIEDK